MNNNDLAGKNSVDLETGKLVVKFYIDYYDGPQFEIVSLRPRNI